MMEDISKLSRMSGMCTISLGIKVLVLLKKIPLRHWPYTQNDLVDEISNRYEFLIGRIFNLPKKENLLVIQNLWDFGLGVSSIFPNLRF